MTREDFDRDDRYTHLTPPEIARARGSEELALRRLLEPWRTGNFAAVRHDLIVWTLRRDEEGNTVDDGHGEVIIEWEPLKDFEG